MVRDASGWRMRGGDRPLRGFAERYRRLPGRSMATSDLEKPSFS
jgi:hypothetical protein